jgi:hypothetical protein
MAALFFIGSRVILKKLFENAEKGGCREHRDSRVQRILLFFQNAETPTDYFSAPRISCIFKNDGRQKPDTENPENAVLGGSQARYLVSSKDFKFLISHAKLTKVTCYLANVMKAISFLSISHYAAIPGWPVMLNREI